MKLKDLTLGYNGLTKTIFLGKIKKNGYEWSGTPEKVDFTIETMCALASMCLELQEEGKKAGFYATKDGKKYKYSFVCTKKEVE